ncbi:glycosyltransferase [Bacteroides stercoris]|nr:glycosyltransferase [Bacteroides stercoris]
MVMIQRKENFLQEQACDKIYFLGLKKNVGDYLKNSDAFALSSLNEAMPITLIEALACGCIPLSTPVSGSVDIIQNGKNGFLSKDFSVDSYITMLKDFFKNHENIDKKELEVYFENNLSMKKMCRKIL